MVKDLEYFLEEENRFCSEHPDYGDFFYDENILKSVKKCDIIYISKHLTEV